MRRLTDYYKGLTMTTTQIKRFAKRVAASTDKAEQRDIRTKLVALLNTVYVIEQLFYVARADRDAQPALEIGLPRTALQNCLVNLYFQSAKVVRSRSQRREKRGSVNQIALRLRDRGLEGKRIYRPTR